MDVVRKGGVEGAENRQLINGNRKTAKEEKVEKRGSKGGGERK
jgi:hypothetical protein